MQTILRLISLNLFAKRDFMTLLYPKPSLTRIALFKADYARADVVAQQ